MRKKVAVIVMLFAMISVFILRSGYPVKFIAENDGVIEWQVYGGGKLI